MSFQRFRTFVVELEVPSEIFSKVFPRTEFLFKHFWTLCLTFRENGLNVATQKFVKNWKMAFSKVHNISLDLKAASKPFSKILPMNNFEFEKFWFVYLTFHQKKVSTWSVKYLQKSKKCDFETLKRFISF